MKRQNDRLLFGKQGEYKNHDKKEHGDKRIGLDEQRNMQAYKNMTQNGRGRRRERSGGEREK